MAKNERLNITISLYDQISKPLGVVGRRINRLSRQVTRATEGMRTGFLLGTGAVLGMVGALNPAIAHSRELAKLSTLGLDAGAMKQVENAAFEAAERFGLSASEIVGSAYDIQSAIAGLSGEELARFTRASAVLSKATLANPAVITDYLGTLYGVFTQQADRMGKAAWVDITAGMTAQAVQMFKVTGPKLARAFSTLGADAVSAGISQAEQFSVLGSLGATMGGGEAASRFKAFLRGVGQAQAQLGLSFSDAQGRMLPVVEILERIRGRLGAIDTVAESDLLKQAFGSDEAVTFLKLMVTQTDTLRANTDALARTKGLRAAEAMADRATIALDRLRAATVDVVIAFGGRMLEALNPVLESMTGVLQAARAWMDRFPNVARAAALLTVSVLGLGLGIAVLKVLWWVLMLALVPFQALLGVLKLGFLSLKAAVLAFNLALLANPMTWIVLGIVTLIAALIAALALAIVYWDEIKAAAGRAWEALLDTPVIKGLLAFWDTLKAAALATVEAIKQAWRGFLDLPLVQGVLRFGRVLGIGEPAPAGERLATRGMRGEEAPELGQAARRAAESTGARRGGDTFNFRVEKMDYGTFRKFALLEGNG